MIWDAFLFNKLTRSIDHSSQTKLIEIVYAIKVYTTTIKSSI